MLREIVIDKRTLAALKKRALAAYPNELFEQIVGEVREGDRFGDVASIFAFRDFSGDDCGTTRRASYLDDDTDPMRYGKEDHRYSILGTVHSHPGDTVDPSQLDWKSMGEDGELIMGIIAIRQSARRRFTTLAFWTSGKRQVPFTIAEPRK